MRRKKLREVERRIRRQVDSFLSLQEMRRLSRKQPVPTFTWFCWINVMSIAAAAVAAAADRIGCVIA